MGASINYLPSTPGLPGMGASLHYLPSTPGLPGVGASIHYLPSTPGLPGVGASLHYLLHLPLAYLGWVQAYKHWAPADCLSRARKQTCDEGKRPQSPPSLPQPLQKYSQCIYFIIGCRIRAETDLIWIEFKIGFEPPPQKINKIRTELLGTYCFVHRLSLRESVLQKKEGNFTIFIRFSNYFTIKLTDHDNLSQLHRIKIRTVFLKIGLDPWKNPGYSYCCKCYAKMISGRIFHFITGRILNFTSGLVLFFMSDRISGPSLVL